MPVSTTPPPPASRSAPPTAAFETPYDSYASHRVEFEAPPSADFEQDSLEKRLMAVQAKVGQQQQDQGQGTGNGNGKGHASRFSIDLSLELERELNSMESPPPVTPLSLPTSGGVQSQKVSTSGGRPPATRKKMTSGPSSESITATGDTQVDPQVLAHLVGELKKSLEDMTKERDDLVQLLTTANEERASDKDALSLLEEKFVKSEEELAAAKKQIKDDEEQIGLLRAKVEESRRGLMRLQTENRRSLALNPTDVSRATLGLSAFTTPASAKRASFAPLTGSGTRGHRRIASVSDGAFGLRGDLELTPTPSPNAQTFAFNSAGTGGESSNYSQPSAALSSGRSGRLSPPSGLIISPHSASTDYSYGKSAPPDQEYFRVPSPSHVALSTELEEIRKELREVKDQLDTTKHELREAVEAKEASETCLSALREFIAEGSTGVAGSEGGAVKLPPMPSMTTGDEEVFNSAPSKPIAAPAPAAKWGFKLWGGGGSVSQSSSMSSSSSLTSATASTAATGAASITTGAGAAPAPLSRKLGGFFTSRSSTSSSNGTPSQPHLPLDQVQGPDLASTTPQTGRNRTGSAGSVESTERGLIQPPSLQYESTSASSSIVEPLSPADDIDGLGSPGYVSAKPGVEGQLVQVDLTEEPDALGTRGIVPAETVSSDLDGLR